jgi:hypothetical protein
MKVEGRQWPDVGPAHKRADLVPGRQLVRNLRVLEKVAPESAGASIKQNGDQTCAQKGQRRKRKTSRQHGHLPANASPHAVARGQSVVRCERLSASFCQVHDSIIRVVDAPKLADDSDPIAGAHFNEQRIGQKFVFAVVLFNGDPTGKALLAFPIFMGVLGIACALVGKLIGFATWLFRRS